MQMQAVANEVWDVTPLVFTIQADLQDEARETIAARLVSDQAIVSHLTKETWESFREKITGVVAECDLTEFRKGIRKVSKLMYNLSLCNSSTKMHFEEMQRNLPSLLQMAQQPYLDTCCQEANKTLSAGVERNPNWGVVKNKVAKTATLRLYLDKTTSERLLDLAAFLLNNRHDPARSNPSLYRDIQLFFERIKSVESKIIEISQFCVKFFEAEISFNRTRAKGPVKEAPKGPFYQSLFIPYEEAVTLAAMRSLKKTLVKDVRSLTSHPGRTKIALKNALSATLQSYRTERHDVPSWKKMIKYSEARMIAWVDEAFLSRIWDSLFSQAEDFDIQAFAWQTLERLPEGQKKGLQKALDEMKSCHQKNFAGLKDNELKLARQILAVELTDKVYGSLFKPLESHLSFHEIKPAC